MMCMYDVYDPKKLLLQRAEMMRDSSYKERELFVQWYEMMAMEARTAADEQKMLLRRRVPVNS